MRCDRFREAVSARLDGEPMGMSVAVLEHHIASCADCARWSSAAERVTRVARLDAVDVPDLAGRITADVVLPVRRVLRRRHLLRAALVLAGIAQVVVGIPAVAGDSMAMAMPTHGAHENAAWNIAIGVAFLAAALAPRRAAGLVPVVGTFVVVLGALSIGDLADGAVTVARLATHTAVLVGLVLLVVLDRTERALPPGRGWARHPAAGTDDERPNLRGVA